MLSVNMLVEWRQPLATDSRRIERVLWLEASNAQVVMFDVENERALPVWCERERIEVSLKTDEARILTVDPYIKLVLPADEWSAKHQAHRDQIMPCSPNLTDAAAPAKNITAANASVVGPAK